MKGMEESQVKALARHRNNAEGGMLGPVRGRQHSVFSTAWVLGFVLLLFLWSASDVRCSLC